MIDKEFKLEEWVEETTKIVNTLVNIINFHTDVLRELCKDGEFKERFDKIGKEWGCHET